jgi:hypothetical protein
MGSKETVKMKVRKYMWNSDKNVPVKNTLL